MHGWGIAVSLRASLCGGCRNSSNQVFIGNVLLLVTEYLTEYNFTLASPNAGNFCVQCLQRSSGALKVCMVDFKFILAKAPPGLEPAKIACPCCDRLWHEVGSPPMPTRQFQAPSRQQQQPRQQVAQNPPSFIQQHPQPQHHQMQISTDNMYPPNAMATMRTPGPNTSAYATVTTLASSTTTTTVDLTSYDAALAGLSSRGPTSSNSVRTGGQNGGNHANAFAVPSTSFGGSGGAGSGSVNTSYGIGGAPDMNHPQCLCGLPGKLCTVSKEGDNKGRTFFGCVKPR